MGFEKRERSRKVMDMNDLSDIELSDGGVIEAPDESGEIRRRDVNGNTMEVRRPFEEGWDAWAEWFEVQMHHCQGSGCKSVFCGPAGDLKESDLPAGWTFGEVSGNLLCEEHEGNDARVRAKGW